MTNQRNSGPHDRQYTRSHSSGSGKKRRGGLFARLRSALYSGPAAILHAIIAVLFHASLCFIPIGVLLIAVLTVTGRLSLSDLQKWPEPGQTLESDYLPSASSPVPEPAGNPETETKINHSATGTAETADPASNGSAPESLPSGLTVDLSGLYSPYAILAELSTGRIVAEQNSRVRMYPASMTKIMTAVLAIEHTEDLNETVTIPSDFFQALYAENASMAGFQPGEECRLKDLLYGILLPSGAECCMAFVERISGSEAEFARLMNEKAQAIGMKNTHFCNATGLHDKDHYSTAEDMAMLLRYALENETFRGAFTSRRYSVPPSNLHPSGFTFHSTMFQSLNSLDRPDETDGILGGKTGYTSEAGLCLASLAEIDGVSYILVTAGADGDHHTDPYHVMDAVNVYGQIRAAGD